MSNLYGSQLSGDQIRLLDVRPANQRPILIEQNDDYIHGSMTRGSLRSSDFVAISYSWGTDSRRIGMHINDSYFAATPNAHAILKMLAQGSTTSAGNEYKYIRQFTKRKVWIDQICVNQHDTQEKQVQVQLMGDIYKSAGTTLIWLGSPAKQDRRGITAFDWLRILVSSMPREKFRSCSEARKNCWNENGFSRMRELMDQPWFHRRWVIQEAALSRDPWMVYGTQSMQWVDFSNAIEFVDLLYADQVAKPSIQTNWYRLQPLDGDMAVAISSMRASGNAAASTHRLLYLLNQFRGSGSVDSRDRIFALLSLCGDAEREANSPRYDASFTFQDTCLRFARADIRIFNDLGVLCMATEDARVIRSRKPYMQKKNMFGPVPSDLPEFVYMPNLPTWVPNLTSLHAQWRLGPKSRHLARDPRPHFSAAGKSGPEVLLLTNTTLAVSGTVVDRVQAVEEHTPIIGVRHSLASSPNFERVWHFARDHTRLMNCYPSRLDLLTAFFRTISAGGLRMDRGGFLSDDHLRRYCLRYFNTTSLGVTLKSEGFAELRPPPHSSARNIASSASDHDPDDGPLIFEKLYSLAFACTESGRMALVPALTQPGDIICVLFGCSSPILLYQTPSSPNGPNHFHTRGEVYMNGIMFGEAIRQCQQGQLKKTVFHLR